MDHLPNLRPRLRQILADIGITTFSQLQLTGSLAAYVKAKRSCKNVSLNLLWALEGALTGKPWQEVAKFHQTSLLLALDDFEKRL